MSDSTENPTVEGSESQELTELLADIRSLTPRARQEIGQAPDLRILEELRVSWLGKKGHFSDFNRRMGALSNEEKPIAGKMLNKHKAEVTNILKARTEELERKSLDDQIRAEAVDVTLPGVRPQRGSLHPVTQVTRELIGIFRDLGFRVERGPEIENEWFNFDALNVPLEHPARDMQDTLYVDRGLVLRTHTSPTQIRCMRQGEPPLAVVTTGKVYRHDSDATHSPMFHQLEAFAVGEDISLGHLKSVLHEFLRALYGKDVKMRLRPSFFPFTEPSAEVDVWNESRGSWMEVLGCGMIHPNVLRNAGIDPEKYSGFALGTGIDRLAMIKFGITDLRLMFDNDVRFLRQF